MELFPSCPLIPVPDHISRWQQLPGSCWRSLGWEELGQVLEFSLSLPCLPLALSSASCHTPNCRWQQEKRFSYFSVPSALGSIFLLLALGFGVSSEPWLGLGHFEGFDERLRESSVHAPASSNVHGKHLQVSMGM